MTEHPNLQSATARERLPARRKPFFERIEPELFLGFRRGQDGGSWVVRYLSGTRQYKVERIGTAERQRNTADGKTVLNYKQALDKARKRGRQRQAEAKGRAKTGDWTVRDAMAVYLEDLADRRKPTAETQRRIERDILPELGDIPLAQLERDQIKRWHRQLAERPPATRPDKHGNAKVRHQPNTEDAKRARRASANRVLTVLRAALNFAFQEGKAPSDAPWRAVKPFGKADTNRKRYLTQAEAQRLVNAAEPCFRELVQGALLTGCRYGELTAMNAGDVDPDSQAVYVAQSKSGKPRHVYLTPEGLAFFQRQTAGKRPEDALFLRQDGHRWARSHARRPLQRACEAAKIEPISFHILRHSYASHAIQNGAPLMVVAENLGHGDTRMVEKFYGHLAREYVRDTIQASAMQLDSPTDNVEPFKPAGSK